MGYYLRYFVSDDKPVTLEILESALKGVDANYEITDRSESLPECGNLFFSNEPYAEITLNIPGDGLFEDEILEFKDSIQDHSEPKNRPVLDVLESAKVIVAVRALFQDRETEATLSRIDPLWDWLDANHNGMSHADGEGFYTNDGVVPDLR